MIASLEQRIDYQVKCDRSILFGATKREIVVKTTTKTTTAAVAEKYIQKRRKKTKPNRFLEAKPNPKSRTLIVDRTPTKEPNL